MIDKKIATVIAIDLIICENLNTFFSPTLFSAGVFF